MLILQNNQLKIELLHPEADQAQMGARYCTGGYIYQVHDAKHGPVLTGPTYPDSFNWFDGQGIPDAFNLSPVHSTQTLGRALVIGTGVCDLPTRKVLTFAEWEVTQTRHRVQFDTLQEFEEAKLALTRTVSLAERTIRSHTQLHNVGSAFIPVRWFPHPFYPQTESDELIWVNAPLRWRADATYVQQTNGFIARAAWPWTSGHYLALDHDAQSPLLLLQRHPLLGLVSAACSYVPDFFPIWGNAHTFSWEPFLERLVAPGQTLTWYIDYTF